MGRSQRARAVKYGRPESTVTPACRRRWNGLAGATQNTGCRLSPPGRQASSGPPASPALGPFDCSPALSSRHRRVVAERTLLHLHGGPRPRRRCRRLRHAQTPVGPTGERTERALLVAFEAAGSARPWRTGGSGRRAPDRHTRRPVFADDRSATRQPLKHARTVLGQTTVPAR